MNNLVYLAGPITGLSYGDSIDWREYAIKKLYPLVGLSPMRGKTYLEGIEKIADSYESSEKINEKSNVAHLSQVMSGARGINTRDFYDCRRSDIVMVNFLGATKVSIGTVMEIAWARAFNVPVILIMEKTGNIHEHAMINECVGFRVENVDDAITVAKMILMPHPFNQVVWGQGYDTSSITLNQENIPQSIELPATLKQEDVPTHISIDVPIPPFIY